MKTYKTKIKDLILFQARKYSDKRGLFYESYNKINLLNFGIKENFVQDNISISKKNVLRGIHFQNYHPQGKLVSVISGEILDVVVDIRKKSHTYGQYETFILSEKNNKCLWIPKYFAHGFLAISKKVILNYKCTDYYYPNDQNTIIWNDKFLNIKWKVKNPIVSAKDKLGIAFKDMNI